MTSQRKCFLVVVLNIIERYVLPGSIVRTDCWAAYPGVTQLGMDLTHQTVNHSETFRDGDVHTNTIEGNVIIRSVCCNICFITLCILTIILNTIL